MVGRRPSHVRTLLRLAVIAIAVVAQVCVGLVPTSFDAARADDAPTLGGQFVPLQRKVFDTRASTQVGDYSTPMPTRTWRNVQIAGVGGSAADAIPASGVAAVAVTFIVWSPSATGTVFADKSDSSPNGSVSYLSYQGDGSRQSNAGIVQVADNGKIQVATSTSVDLTIEVMGYYTEGDNVAAGGYVPITPARVADSRTTGTAIPYGRLAADSYRTIQVGGSYGVPADASAVVINMVAREAGASGYLLAYPADEGRPLGGSYYDTMPTSLGAQVGLARTGSAVGAIKIYNSAASSVHLVIDVVGYFAPGQSDGGFVPTGTRLLSTRDSGQAALAGGATRSIAVVGQRGLPGPEGSLQAVAMALHVSNSSSEVNGVRVWPSSEPEPGLSGLTYDANSTTSNFMTVELGDDGAFKIHNLGSNPVHLYIDIQGWYVEAVTPPDTSPPGELTPDTPVGPSRVFGGVVQNANGTPQAGLTVEISDPTSTPETGTEQSPAYDPLLGTATTDSEGRWTYVLPDPLPETLADEADANAGVLNLTTEVLAYDSRDGTPLSAISPVDVGVGTRSQQQAQAAGRTAFRANADGTESGETYQSSDFVANAVEDQTDVVLPLHVPSDTPVAPPADEPEEGPTVPEMEEEDGTVQSTNTAGARTISVTTDDEAATRGTTPQDAGAEDNPDVVDGVDYRGATASSTPVYSDGTAAPGASQTLSRRSAASAEAAKPKRYYNCGRYGAVAYKHAVRYTVVGEMHSYWDTKSGFVAAESIRYESKLKVSADGKFFSVSGAVSKSSETGSSVGLLAPYKHYGYKVELPFRFRWAKYKARCAVYEGDEARFVGYEDRLRYVEGIRRYYPDSQHLSIRRGANVDYQDGPKSFRQSRQSRRPFPANGYYDTKRGKGKGYEYAAEVFGGWFTFTGTWAKTTSSEVSQRIYMGPGTRRHHWVFQHYCDFRRQGCNPRAYYSW